jgi:hypothetical protein
MNAEEIRQAIRDEEGKRIVKEAINEWLEKKFADIGKWTLGGLGAAALAAVTYFILTSQGWHK